jgi:betaine-aldehyde dehydrogenase/5-carboxymethyl-2-hydroxymuconic-semialdehyde dehydrogenase
MPDVQCGDLVVSGDHFVGGRRISSPETMDIYSPIDGARLGQVSAAGTDEVDLAVNAASRAFPAWRALGPAGRGPILRRLADLIERDVEPLARIETLNNGSLLEAGRLRVMKRAALNIRFFADVAERLCVPDWDVAASNAHFRVAFDPAGVTALITPWNAPLMLATWKVGPALAAGNTVVLKPAEWTPLTASMLADLAVEAGMPPGVLNVVQGVGERAGAALVAHGSVRRISFTGSPETARLIGAAAARHLTPVSFELGGKSPFIVCADADLDRALATAHGQYDNAGQVCQAGTRILIERSIYDTFVERLVEGISRLHLGDPRDPSTEVGPLITRQHLGRVAGFVKRAIEAGATLLCGGRVSPALGGLYFEPTLFADVPADSEILQQEVFGPVLTVQPFDTDEDAIHLGNSTEYGLAATVFTQDARRADRFAESLVAGTVWVNCFFVRDLAAPFGGARQSGIGREGGQWSFDFYCDVKTIVHRNGSLRRAS